MNTIINRIETLETYTEKADYLEHVTEILRALDIEILEVDNLIHDCWKTIN